MKLKKLAFSHMVTNITHTNTKTHITHNTHNTKILSRKTRQRGSFEMKKKNASRCDTPNQSLTRNATDVLLRARCKKIQVS